MFRLFVVAVVFIFSVASAETKSPFLLTAEELQSLKEHTIEYDYGETAYGRIIAYAYTDKDGNNYSDFNGKAFAFGSERELAKTKAIIKDNGYCLYKSDGTEGSCWIIERTGVADQFVGRGPNGRFYADMKILGKGDVRNMVRRFNLQSSI